MRAAIYARVSTDEQAEKGSSLGNQIAECRRYAGLNNFDVVGEFKDDISGKLRLFERPEGRRLQSMVAGGEVGAVVVHRVDRLSRDLIDIMQVTREWLRAGVELYAMDVGRIESENDIVLVIKGWQGGDEHKKIVERTSSGRNAKAERGTPVMAGHPPYGYRRTGKANEAKMLIDEMESEVVKKIFNWYVVGDGNNGPLSLRAIASKLEEQGEPTPNHKKNSAQYWIPTTIRGILTNEIYTGITYYGKSRCKAKKRTKQPRENWTRIDIPELAIIDSATFNLVQERAKKNQEQAKRNKKAEYLMAGFFRCGACGNAMAGTFSGKLEYRYKQYRCGNHWHGPTEEPCEYKNRSITASIVEALVWDWIIKLISNDEELEAGLKKMGDRNAEELLPTRERMNSVAEMLEKAEKKIERLVSSLSEEDDDVIAGAIKDKMKIISKQIEALKKEKASIQSDLSRVELTPAMQDGIRKMARQVRGKLDAPTISQKRALFDSLDFKAVYRIDEGGRWLDVQCELKPDGDVIMLPLSSGSFRR